MVTRIAVTALSLLSLSSYVLCQSGPPKFLPRRDDVKHIKCEVCGHLASNAFDQVQALLIEKGKKVRCPRY